MTAAELLAASQREVRGYRTLVAAYEAMARAVAEGVGLDVPPLADVGMAVDAALVALRETTATLGPERLAARVVPHEVTGLWREAAALAARAAELNAALAAATEARAEPVAGRLATLAAGRRALAGYRPATTPHTVNRHA
ncbi:MAG: hypothetical protein ACREQL_03555 [Candidatus Binatia bacterium]